MISGSFLVGALFEGWLANLKLLTMLERPRQAVRLRPSTRDRQTNKHDTGIPLALPN